MMDTSSSALIHPRDALYENGLELPALPVCEHIAGNERMIRKALDLQRALGGVFDLTCDCEDGARVGAEHAHVMMIARLLREVETPAGRVGVRVHHLSHPAFQTELDGVLAAAADRIAYITLPKAEGADDVAQMLERMASTAARMGVPMPKIHVLIETHGALAGVRQIAALPQVETLDFGLFDFVSAHHGVLGFDAMRSPLQFEHPLLVRAKTEIVAAALEFGVVPTHNVSLMLRDPVQVGHDAQMARERFGFLRMWSIHPMQIEPIVQAMQPSAAAVLRAGRILLAAQAAGWGPIDDAGELHDRASYRYGWSLLRRAHAAHMTLETDVLKAFF